MQSSGTKESYYDQVGTINYYRIDCLHAKHTKFNQYMIQKVILVVQGNTDKHMHICRLQTDNVDKYKAKLI